MSGQLSPDSNAQPQAIASDGSAQTPTKSIQEQHIDLKLEVEQIYRKVDRLRTGLQTLVSGLMVAILISLGVATWFSYRLLLEEKRASQETQQTLELQKEMLERLDILEERIDSQERQIRQAREQIPQDINPLIEENRKQLQQLQEKLEKLENVQAEEEEKEE
ncbi:MAG: hypothetical protein J7647_08590 [Cyanobacteria bacterium SBLK]|nr:hypothetical protein [Cyanobacteria bacterium SBLK]